MKKLIFLINMFIFKLFLITNAFAINGSILEDNEGGYLSTVHLFIENNTSQYIRFIGLKNTNNVQFIKGFSPKDILPSTHLYSVELQDKYKQKINLQKIKYISANYNEDNSSVEEWYSFQDEKQEYSFKIKFGTQKKSKGSSYRYYLPDALVNSLGFGSLFYFCTARDDNDQQGQRNQRRAWANFIARGSGIFWSTTVPIFSWYKLIANSGEITTRISTIRLDGDDVSYNMNSWSVNIVKISNYILVMSVIYSPTLNNNVNNDYIYRAGLTDIKHDAVVLLKIYDDKTYESENVLVRNEIKNKNNIFIFNNQVTIWRCNLFTGVCSGAQLSSGDGNLTTIKSLEYDGSFLYLSATKLGSLSNVAYVVKCDVNVKSCATIYALRYKRDITDLNNPVISSLLLYNDKIYIGTRNGKVLECELNSTHKCNTVLSANEIKSRITSLIHYGDNLYIAAELGDLYSYNLQSKELNDFGKFKFGISFMSKDDFTLNAQAKFFYLVSGSDLYSCNEKKCYLLFSFPSDITAFTSGYDSIGENYYVFTSLKNGKVYFSAGLEKFKDLPLVIADEISDIMYFHGSILISFKNKSEIIRCNLSTANDCKVVISIPGKENFNTKLYNASKSPLIPYGDYIESCDLSSISFNGAYLSGNCKNQKGDHRYSVLNYGKLCNNKTIISNKNGELECV